MKHTTHSLGMCVVTVLAYLNKLIDFNCTWIPKYEQLYLAFVGDQMYLGRVEQIIIHRSPPVQYTVKVM